uniref:Uncharacterized protein n=1 Tax=Tetradesmus obliquus TaxID=3088 RepID=A0A383WDE1_TETOB|eukprot:jgi/Sobl393_1/5328/SZX75637.1
MQQPRRAAPAAAAAAAAATWTSSTELSHQGSQQHVQRACRADDRVAMEPDLAPSCRAAKRQAELLLRAAAWDVCCSGNLLFYWHVPCSSFSTVPFRDAVAAAVTRCRSLRLQHIDQQCSELRALIHTLEARRAQQRRHEQQQHIAAGIRRLKNKRGYSRYDGTEETDDGSSSSSYGSSGSDSSGGGSGSDNSGNSSGGNSNSNSDDGCSGCHSDPDNYFKEVARYAGLPRSMSDAADYSEDDPANWTEDDG